MAIGGGLIHIEKWDEDIFMPGEPSDVAKVPKGQERGKRVRWIPTERAPKAVVEQLKLREQATNLSNGNS